LEIQELLAKAEQADSAPLQEGLTIPEEIQRRQGPRKFFSVKVADDFF
jgi:hypothetical protein